MIWFIVICFIVMAFIILYLLKWCYRLERRTDGLEDANRELKHRLKEWQEVDITKSAFGNDTRIRYKYI